MLFAVFTVTVVQQRLGGVLFFVSKLVENLLETLHRVPCILPLSHGTA